MDLIKDIYKFFKLLSVVDIIFLIAIVILLILLVILFYFIRINKDVLDEDDFFPHDDKGNGDKNKEEIKEEKQVEKIIDKIHIEPKFDDGDEYNDEEGELLDLESLTKKLQMEEKDRVSCTEYEKDQEEKAIISYEELLQKHNRYGLNYETEKRVDDLVIKKVDLQNLENKNIEDDYAGVRVISYKREEAFLCALKELNSLLN